MQLHRLVKLKGSASDTLRKALQKSGEKKDELCKISLNIALQRMMSHMPVISKLRRDSNWHALTLALYSRGKLVLQFV